MATEDATRGTDVELTLEPSRPGEYYTSFGDVDLYHWWPRKLSIRDAQL